MENQNIVEPIIYKWILLNTFKNIARDVIEDDLSKAFKEWEQFINVYFQKISAEEFIKISEINPEARNYYIITLGFFAKDHDCIESFDDKSGILAHAMFADNKFRKNLFIHFDAKETWVFGDQQDSIENLFLSTVKFKSIATHEIGHVLGLNHDEHINSIMNPDYKALINKPSTIDILHIREKFLGTDKESEEQDSDVVIFLKVYYLEIIQGIVLCIILYYLYRTR